MKKLLSTLGVLALVGGLLVATPAQASLPNMAWSWETHFGARWNGAVQIRASYNDAGRHAIRGYHRFIREAGPALDTRRMYTTSTTSRDDPRFHSRVDRVWDSPLWGDRYTTRHFHGFDWFPGPLGMVDSDDA